jgi:hypothetical protein
MLRLFSLRIGDETSLPIDNILLLSRVGKWREIPCGLRGSSIIPAPTGKCLIETEKCLWENPHNVTLADGQMIPPACGPGDGLIQLLLSRTGRTITRTLPCHPFGVSYLQIAWLNSILSKTG